MHTLARFAALYVMRANGLGLIQDFNFISLFAVIFSHAFDNITFFYNGRFLCVLDKENG